jgi:hypothetical protein
MLGNILENILAKDYSREFYIASCGVFISESKLMRPNQLFSFNNWFQSF